VLGLRKQHLLKFVEAFEQGFGLVLGYVFGKRSALGRVDFGEFDGRTAIACRVAF
jgi:hypothetical protein